MSLSDYEKQSLKNQETIIKLLRSLVGQTERVQEEAPDAEPDIFKNIKGGYPLAR